MSKDAMDTPSRKDLIDIVEYNDDSVMPFGKHKGKRMGDIPYTYLCWLLENCNHLNKKFVEYLEDKLENYTRDEDSEHMLCPGCDRPDYACKC